MRLNVLLSIYMYVSLSISVTYFLLFEALVADWHVKQVASWNKVFNIIVIIPNYSNVSLCVCYARKPSRTEQNLL